MRIFLKYISIFIMLFSFNISYWLEDYESYENLELIENYLIKHKNNIVKIVTQYELENNNTISWQIWKIDYLIQSIEKIKNSNINENNKDKARKTIINEIKNINTELKDTLKKEISKYNSDMDKTISIYHEIWVRLSKKIDSIYLKFYNPELENKKVLTISESKLKNSIKNLNKISKKLNEFDKIKFTKKEEIKESFIRLLKELRVDLYNIKTYYK